MAQGFPISFCSSQHFVHHSQSKPAACLTWTNKEKLQEHSWLTFVCLFVCCQFGWGCCFQKCLLRYSWWKLLLRPAETGVRLYTTLPHKHQIIHWAVCMYTFLTLLLLFASTELAWTVHAVTATGVYQNVGKFCFALMYQVPLAALYFISYNTECIQLKSKYGDTAANTHCYSRLFLSYTKILSRSQILKKLTFNLCFWLLDVCRFCCCSFCIVSFLFLCKLILTNPVVIKKNCRGGCGGGVVGGGGSGSCDYALNTLWY